MRPSQPACPRLGPSEAPPCDLIVPRTICDLVLAGRSGFSPTRRPSWEVDGLSAKSTSAPSRGGLQAGGRLVDVFGVAGVMRAASKLQESPQIRKKPSPGTRSLRVKVLSDSQKCL